MSGGLRPRTDRRPLALAIALLAVLALGLVLGRLPGRGYIEAPVVASSPVGSEPAADRPAADETAPAPPADPRTAPQRHASEARRQEVDARFQQAVTMLHARRYELAVTALHRVLELAPTLVEAHVNMGYALIGSERHRAAADFFLSAIELRPQQANAYYGLAVALEALGDYPGALGAMRTFIHLTEDPDDPYLRKARAALWEWQARLEQAGTGEGGAPPAPGATAGDS